MRSELAEKIDFKGLETYCRKSNVLALYLFGSRLTEEHDRFSDLDLGVLFYPSFSDKISRIDFCMKFNDELAGYFDCRKIDLIFLQKAGIKITFRIITGGEIIFSADEQKRLDFEDIVICKGLDFKAELALYYRELEEEILRESR